MMKLKDGKASATLTELKNKIGDVFAMVDKMGEVTITSYNKTAYKIVKVDRVFTTTEDVHAEAVKIEDKLATPAPVAAPVASQPNIEVQIYKPEVVNMPASPVAITPEIKPAPQIPVVQHQGPKAIPATPVAQSPVGEVWDRSNAREVAWVQTIKNLF
jgi:hypothetical protein